MEVYIGAVETGEAPVTTLESASLIAADLRDSLRTLADLCADREEMSSEMDLSALRGMMSLLAGGIQVCKDKIDYCVMQVNRMERERSGLSR